MPLDVDAAARRSADLESAAEAVEHGKQHLVDLDRRMHLNREGLRALKSVVSSPSVFVLCPGGLFVRTTPARATRMLEADTEATKKSIESAREALKQKVVDLAHLEGPDSALSHLNSGFDLKPL